LREVLELPPYKAPEGNQLVLFTKLNTLTVFSGHQGVAEIEDAYKLLSPLLGVKVASLLFALALLASGQSSTLTATLAGQIVMEGFLNLRITPWLRRLGLDKREAATRGNVAQNPYRVGVPT